MYTKNVELRILVNGRPTREYSHKGAVFTESRHGTNYTVKIKNDNGHRVMAILSVDGLDVITGKPAEDVNKGYIIDAYSYVEIKGYRISDSNSASFVFSSKDKSYVAKTTGSSRNSGVIGVRVFKEKEQPRQTTITYQYIPMPVYVHPWNPWITGGYDTNINSSGVIFSGNDSATVNLNSSGAGTTTAYTATFGPGVSAEGTYIAPGSYLAPGTVLNSGASTGVSAKCRSACAASQQANVSNAFDSPISYKDFDTGTAWGKKLDDKVVREYFERGELLAELVVYYASRSALIDMGIDLDEDTRIAEHQAPQAFGGKYCVPPKGWQG